MTQNVICGRSSYYVEWTVQYHERRIVFDVISPISSLLIDFLEIVKRVINDSMDFVTLLVWD